MIDELMDGVAYIFSFEWLGDTWEFVTGMFENLGEFSIAGVVFGILSAGLIFFLRQWMLQPFLQNMTPLTATFWMIATYIACFVVGYLVGKKMFDE